MRARVLVAGLATFVFVLAIGAAAAQAVTPGWECVPTTAGQAVVSGGTGGAPACGAGTRAVLAPTYISSGVGKPTAGLSAVNAQIVNGGTSEATIDGIAGVYRGFSGCIELGRASPRVSPTIGLGRSGWGPGGRGAAGVGGATLSAMPCQSTLGSRVSQPRPAPRRSA